MKCPFCGSKTTRVIGSAKKGEDFPRFSKNLVNYLKEKPDYVLRRRRCQECFKDFMTVEELILKEDGKVWEGCQLQ